MLKLCECTDQSINKIYPFIRLYLTPNYYYEEFLTTDREISVVKKGLRIYA